MSVDKEKQGMSKTNWVTEEKPLLKKPNMYRIVLLNDDYTPREFVIWAVMKVFYKTQDESNRIMLEAHTKGKSTIDVCTYDIAKSKVAQVARLAQKYEHPLKCILEIESGGDES